MTKALYDSAREAFLQGDIDWINDDIKVVLVDTNDYTVDLASHQVLSDIPAGARVATSANLSNKSSVAGVADADDASFTSVTGYVSEALVIYKDTGDPANSPLICYNTEATGLPVNPNGGDIAVHWGSGSEKIFKL